MKSIFFGGIAAVALAVSALGQTQTLTTRTLVADMTPSAENPAIEGVDASATASIGIHIIRDQFGEVTAGIADFRIMWAFGEEQVVRAMHIHEGPAGVNGPVVIDSEFTSGALAGPGSGTFLQTSGLITDPALIAKLMQIMANPAGFYVNLHTATFPGGIMRGQLSNAERHMLMSANSKLDALQTAVDALAADDDDAGDPEVARIGKTVDAIARRLGIVPAQ